MVAQMFSCAANMCEMIILYSHLYQISNQDCIYKHCHTWVHCCSGKHTVYHEWAVRNLNCFATSSISFVHSQYANWSHAQTSLHMWKRGYGVPLWEVKSDCRINFLDVCMYKLVLHSSSLAFPRASEESLSSGFKMQYILTIFTPQNFFWKIKAQNKDDQQLSLNTLAYSKAWQGIYC